MAKWTLTSHGSPSRKTIAVRREVDGKSVDICDSNGPLYDTMVDIALQLAPGDIVVAPDLVSVFIRTKTVIRA